jgi:hypothetical protein
MTPLGWLTKPRANTDNRQAIRFIASRPGPLVLLVFMAPLYPE